MAIALVQSKSANAASGTMTLTWDSTPTQNNLIVIALSIRSDANPSDPAGYSTAATVTNETHNDYLRIIYKIAGASESNPAWTGLDAPAVAGGWEFSGIATSTPLDASGTVDSNGAELNTPLTTASTGTLAQADEVAIAAWGIRDFGSLASVAVDSGFTLTHSLIPATVYLAGAYKIVSATTALQPSLTWTSALWQVTGSGIATFKAGGGANATPILMQMYSGS